MTIETDEPHDAGNLQHTQAIFKIEVNKNVSREKHQVQFLAPIFPSTYAPVHGQETVYAPLFQLPRDLFFVTGTDVRGVPVGLQLNCRLRISCY